jgi:hypothetical protein
MLTRAPFYGIEDTRDTGSLAVVNSDMIESVAVLSGAFPAKYGDRNAAVLKFDTREGNRDRISHRANANFTGAWVTSEGPLGKSKKGSWLASARKSYLQYLLNRLGSDSLAIGYYDAQSKLSYNPSERHSLVFRLLHGQAAVDRDRQNYTLTGDLTNATNLNQSALLSWTWAPSSTTVSQLAAQYARQRDRSQNSYGNPLERSNADQLDLREDFLQQVSRSGKLDAGFSARHMGQSFSRSTVWDYVNNRETSTLFSIGQFSRQAWQTATYAQYTLTSPGKRLAIILGGRWERLDLTNENLWMPRASISLNVLPRTRLMAAWGQYGQFAELRDFFGEFGTPGLRAERSTHAVAGFEHLLSDRLRFRVEAYNRFEHGKIYSPETEVRLVSNVVTYPHLGPVLGNSLLGYSRGIEFTLQRRSANRLSGWISYARGFTRYWQPGTRLAFWGDFDQRHTFNAYGSYRLSKTISVSGNGRYGSNFPMPGFIGATTSANPESTHRQEYPSHFIVESRNLFRYPAYARVDIRASKAFYRDRSKLTLYFEIANLLGRDNWFYSRVPADHTWSSGTVVRERERLLPFLPSAGLTWEF